MSKAEFKISMEVLNSLSPQRGMLNAKAEDLKDQTFTLHSMVAPENRKAQLEKPTEDNLFVKARYVNTKNSKAFLIPIRGLLNMAVVELGSENVEFEEGETETTRVHEYLMEHIKGDAKAIGLPEKFTVVSVKDRVQESTGRTMYPPYCYDRFNARVKELRDADPKASLDPIYQDYEFMQSLYADERADRHQNAEANKDLVISI